MSYSTTFSPDIKSIIVRFNCNNCGNKIESEEIMVPYHNNNKQKTSNPYTKSEGIAMCSQCKNDFDIDVCSGAIDSYIEIFEIDDTSITYEEVVDESVFKDYMNEQIDAIVRSVNYIEQFEIEIENLKKLNAIILKDSKLQKTLQKQIYSGTITCLEDYLSSTLIRKVLHNEDYFKNFVFSYKKFKDRKFDFNEIYTKLDNIVDIVKHELLDVIYHDLRKVRGIYKDTLKINFPAIAELMIIISKRHDIVHRNGKNKSSDKIEITEKVVRNAIDKVYCFIQEIENNIELKEIEKIEF
ncbi:MAG: hypothetical protein KBT58_01935 [Bizionia sp.]|nr:hypothetical protein [Bizionia sp.]